MSTGDKSACAHSIQEWEVSIGSFYAAVLRKEHLCSDKKILLVNTMWARKTNDTIRIFNPSPAQLAVGGFPDC